MIKFISSYMWLYSILGITSIGACNDCYLEMKKNYRIMHDIDERYLDDFNEYYLYGLRQGFKSCVDLYEANHIIGPTSPKYPEAPKGCNGPNNY